MKLCNRSIYGSIHGIDIAASSFIDPVGEPNARLAGVAVLDSVVASPVSVAAAIAALDGVAAVDARGRAATK